MSDKVFPTTADQGIMFEPLDGLTKRELFAAMAMAGLFASPEDSLPHEVQDIGGLVDHAVFAADSLIAALAMPRKEKP